MDKDLKPGIGEILRKTREDRKLSLARVAEDTNIGPAYLSGLESGDYTGFHGEPYIIGFLRNYAEYLEIDPDPLIAEYKASRGIVPEQTVAPVTAPRPDIVSAKPGRGHVFARKAAEEHLEPAPLPDALRKPVPSPTPENETASGTVQGSETPGGDKAFASITKRTGEKKPVSARFPSLVPALAILAVLIVAVSAFFIVKGRNQGGDYSSAGKPALPVEYRIEGSAFEKRIYPGDSILAVIDTDTYKLRLASITDTVNIETPLGLLSLMLGEETHIDFNKDKVPELKLTVADFARKEGRSGALIRIEYFAQKSPDSTASTDITVGPNDIQSAEPTARKTGILFRSSKGPYPFVATITFRAACMFRYEADRREWKERYYSKGETITVNADNSLVVWASNAQAAKITITASGGKTADLELGAPGEVAVKRIGWSQSEGSWVMSAVEND